MTVEETGKRKGWKIALKILRVFISVFFIGFLISRIDLDETVSLLRSARVPILLAVVPVIVGNIIINCKKWQILLRLQDIRISFGKLTQFFYVGLFFNQFLPSGLGGDAMKSWDVYRESKKGLESVSSTLLVRYTGMIAISVIALAAAFMSVELMRNGSVLLFLGLFFGVLLLVSVLSVNRLFLATVTRCLNFVRLKIAADYYRKIHVILLRTVQNKKALILIMVYSFIYQLVAILVYYLIGKGLSLEIPFYVYLTFVPIITVLSMLPLSVNGIGIREGSFAYFFGLAGVPAAHAVTIPIVLYAYIILFGITGGIIYATRK